jgi:hypothetical protein
MPQIKIKVSHPEKIELFLKLMSSGIGIVAACKQSGISHVSIYKWLNYMHKIYDPDFSERFTEAKHLGNKLRKRKLL